LEGLIKEFGKTEIFSKTIKDTIYKIVNGEYYTDYSSIISMIISILFGNFKSFLPYVLTIVGIGFLSNIVVNFKSDGDKSTKDIINFVFLSFITLIILVVFKNVLDNTKSTISSLFEQMQLIFPILISLLASVGSVATISIVNPTVAILTNLVSIIFENFLYPLFFIVFVFTIIGQLSESVKLEKLNNFFISTFKWLMGLVVTIFTGFLAIQGISAGRFDSISIKTTKFTIKSYIPIIGSFISDGMDFIVLGSILVKNAIGLVGVLIVFVTIISPIINLIIIKLGLQLTSAILDLMGSNKLSSYVNNCNRILIYPIVIILGVSLMYVITICLIMCTANIF
jgi:stage III sporulation protein AE